MSLKLNISNSITSTSASAIFYQIALLLYLSVEIANTSLLAQYIPGSILSLSRYGIVGLLLLSELCEKEKGIPFLIGLFSAFIIVAFSYAAFGFGFLLIALLIFCSRNIPLDRIARLSFYTISACTIAVILLSLIGYIDDFVFVIDGRIRHYLGFKYSLYPSKYLFEITCLFIYIHRNKIKLKYIIIFLLVNLGMYCQTMSRLSFGLSTLFLLVVFAIRNIDVRGFAHFKFLVPSFIMFFIVSMSVAASYDPSNQVLSIMNQFLGGRIELAHSALINYGVSIASQGIDFFGMGLNNSGRFIVADVYNYVDCLYVLLPVQYGVIFTTLYLVLMTAISFKAWKHSNYVLLIVMFFNALYGLIDDLSINIYFNVFMLAAGELMLPMSRQVLRLRRKVFFNEANDRFQLSPDSRRS